jgi:hypothetical protein
MPLVAVRGCESRSRGREWIARANIGLVRSEVICAVSAMARQLHRRDQVTFTTSKENADVGHDDQVLACEPGNISMSSGKVWDSPSNWTFVRQRGALASSRDV